MACPKGCGTGFDQVEGVLQGFDATSRLEATASTCELPQVLDLVCCHRAAEAISRLQRSRSRIKSRFGSKSQLLWRELIDIQNHGDGQINRSDCGQFFGVNVGLSVNQRRQVGGDIEGISAFSGSPFSLGLLQFSRKVSEGEAHSGDQFHRPASPETLADGLQVNQAHPHATEAVQTGRVTEAVQVVVQQQGVEERLMNQGGQVRKVLPAR